KSTSAADARRSRKICPESGGGAGAPRARHLLDGMKILFLADVSGQASHVGDEAMLEANIRLFRRLLPHCSIEVAAGSEWDGSRLEVKAVQRLEFPPDSEI